MKNNEPVLPDTFQNDLEQKIENAATIFAFFALTSSLLFIFGLPFFILGLVIFLIEGTLWPLIFGGITFLVSIMLGFFAYRWMLKFKQTFEMPRYRNRVFISYRTNEHTQIVEQLTNLLENEGVKGFSVKSGSLFLKSEDLLPVFVSFRILGLFQTGGLASALLKEISKSDSIIYIESQKKREYGSWQTFKDKVDGLIGLFLFRFGLSPISWKFMWYAGIYNRIITPPVRLFKNKGWQEWELVIARQLGLNIYRIALDSKEGYVSDDLIYFRSDLFETDFKEKLLNKLKYKPREELKLKGIIPIGFIFTIVYVSLILSVGFAVLVLGVYFAIISLF